MGRLIVDSALCVACRNCSMACAIDRHSLSKDALAALGEMPRPVPRVRVAAVGAGSVPVQCRHCSPAPCVMACPTGAMTTVEDGTVLHDEERCLKCFMCVAACPFGACQVAKDRRSVIKCDLCPNREVPACADACPTGALKYEA